MGVIKFLAAFSLVILNGAIALTQRQDSLPIVKKGSIIRIPNFQSKFVTPRHVDVWLPANYALGDQSFEVLYMHDGQMLYDPSKTWNKQAWEVDDILDSLLSKNKIRPFIVVGIWNGGTTRHSDYFPQKPYNYLSKKQKSWVTEQLVQKGRISGRFAPKSDDYLKFIVQELKPYIDKNFSVKKDKQSTYIAGSSMGGLISLYALCEYPKIFAGAACLSTHWPGVFTTENNPIPAAFVKYIRKKLQPKNAQKIYFDYGDQTLDALYPALQKEVDRVLKSKNLAPSFWKTIFFPNSDHSEKAWHNRFNEPVLFLFGKE